jgi:PAS domain S-box-containing protein
VTDEAPSAPKRRLALGLALVGLATLAVLPVEATRLSAQLSFVPAMLALVGCFDVLSTLLLLRQFLDTGDRVPLRLSWAYLFTLIVLVGYGASFPGVLGSHPALGLHPSTAPWLWACWHTGFPALLALAMTASWSRSRGIVVAESRRRMMWSSVAACVGAGIVAVVIASVFGGHLPVLIHGDDLLAMTNLLGPVMYPLVTLAAVVTVFGAWRRQGPERWAAIAAAASVGDVVLTLSSRYRYSIGWYAGRTLTIAGSAAVLVALLFEFAKVKSDLAAEGEQLSAALRRADELERLKQTLLDNMVDGVTLRSPSGELIASNAAAPQLLGLSFEQLGGLAPPDPDWRVQRPEGQSWTAIDKTGIETIVRGASCQDEMIGVTTPDGTLRWLCANTVSVNDAHGLLEGVVTTYADVTDSHGEEVRLAQHQRTSRRRIEAVLEGSDDCLRIVFQPIVELSSGEVVGYEALSRFSSEPLRPPNEWFSEAAEVGLGVEFELYALRAALADWNRSPCDAYLSLNVSPDTVMSPALMALLETVACDRIVIEITEHAGIEDYAALGGALAQLRAKGLRVAIDDAGAGYSSLRHILYLRPDIIKLDVALTRGIDADPARQALAVALVSFRQQVGAVLVAEGIETENELAVLMQLGVRHGQGFYLGRPGRLSDRPLRDSTKTALPA